MKRSNWYYNINGQKQGPVSLKTLKQMISNGLIGKHTPLWHPSMDSWKQVNEIKSFSKYIPKKWFDEFSKLKSEEYQTTTIPTPIKLDNTKLKERKFTILFLTFMYISNIFVILIFLFSSKTIYIKDPLFSEKVINIFTINSKELYTTQIFVKWFFLIAKIWSVLTIISYLYTIISLQKKVSAYLNLKFPSFLQRLVSVFLHFISISLVFITYVILVSKFQNVVFSKANMIFIYSIILIFPPLFIKVPYSKIQS